MEDGGFHSWCLASVQHISNKQWTGALTCSSQVVIPVYTKLKRSPKNVFLSFRSFSELVSLLRSDQDWRATAEPGSLRLRAPPLVEQRHKMETISQHLSLAEEAERTGTHTHTQSLDSILLIPVRLHLVIRSVCLCVSDIMSVRLLLVEHRTRLRSWFRTRWLLLQISGPPSARSVSFWVGSSQTPRTFGSASTSTTAVLTERKGGSPEQPPRPGPAWLSCTWIEVHTPSIVTVNDQNHSTLLIPEESMWSQLLQDSRNSNWLIWITNDDSE